MGTVHNSTIPRHTPLSPSGPIERRTPIRKRNPERLARLQVQQFGPGEYKAHIKSLSCLVCGCWPVDPAHVLKTRAAGGGPEGMAPLCREHHIAFESIGEDRFELLLRISKADIRAWAKEHRTDWEGLVA